jgi:hypothetical protein
VANIGAVEKVWFCTRCNAEVGRGPNPPSRLTCPNCGARFSVGVVGGIAGGIALLIGLVAFAIRKAMA